MDYDEARREVHEAVASFLDEGEIAICWTLCIDVAGPGGIRYLAHRSGGGADGTESPEMWTALGMLLASVQTAEDQLRAMTTEVEGDDDNDEPGEGEE